MVCIGYRELYRKDIKGISGDVIKNVTYLLCELIGTSEDTLTNLSPYDDEEFVLDFDNIDGFPKLKNVSLAPGSTFYETDESKTKHLSTNFTWQ